VEGQQALVIAGRSAKRKRAFLKRHTRPLWSRADEESAPGVDGSIQPILRCSVKLVTPSLVVRFAAMTSAIVGVWRIQANDQTSAHASAA
jgi:hypothetical protein